MSYVAQQNDQLVDASAWATSSRTRSARNCTGSHQVPERSERYLTTVFAGFEIWNGGVGLETKDFGVTVP